jgi:flagellar P-ring protein FlgI
MTRARIRSFALRVTLALLALLRVFPGDVQAERIKDIASVQGVRPNQLIGYGLVVGLDGTGDQTTQTPFTAGVNMQLKNVAAVMVTAMLPAFAKPGQTLDVTVSSMGNAKSLRGGTLLLTPLRGADAQVYGIAQGSVIIAGAGASAGGAKAQINQLNSGRIPSGATVERAVESPLLAGDTVDIELFSTDFGSARRVAEAVNKRLGQGIANALDGRVIRVFAPRSSHERIEFLAQLEEISVDAVAAPARVIFNARTGSVVMNQAVMLEPCAVAHGNLSVTISSTPEVSQPNPLSGGQTVKTEKNDIQIRQENANLLLMPAGTRLADVVKALNALGANPQDLLAILQAMKAAGALRAELEVI